MAGAIAEGLGSVCSIRGTRVVSIDTGAYDDREGGVQQQKQRKQTAVEGPG